MKLSFALSLLMLVSTSHFAQAASPRCIENLVKGGYCNDTQAEIICELAPQGAIGCAMDMVDMKMSADIFDALDYCRFPFPAPAAPPRVSASR